MKSKMEEMRKININTRERNAERLAKCKPHVKDALKSKNIEFLREIATIIKYEDMDIFDQIWNGFDVDGPIPVSNIWPSIPLDHKLAQNGNEVNPRKRRKIDNDFISTPPNWGTPYVWEKLWDDMKVKIEKGHFIEVPPEKIPDDIMPAKGFPVSQKGFHIVTDDQGNEERRPNRVRPCFDYRSMNKGCQVKEALVMGSVTNIIKTCEALISEPGLFTKGLQTRKDLYIDIINERARSGIISADQAKSEIDTILKLKIDETQDTSPSILKGSPLKDIGIIALDWSGFYLQWAARYMERNLVFVYDTDHKKWRFFSTSRMQFGSLHSIYECCRISMLYETIIQRFLKIPCQIYIDDSTIIIDQERIHLAGLAVKLLFDLSGIDQSIEKEDILKQDNPITILGKRFTILKDHMATNDKSFSLAVTPTFDTIVKTRIAITDALSALDDDSITSKHIEIAAGKLIWLTFMRDHKRNTYLFRAIYSWTREDFMKKHKKSKEGRRNLKYILNSILMRISDDIFQYSTSISSRRLQDRDSVIITDASEPENPAIGGLIWDSESSNNEWSWFSQRIEKKKDMLGAKNHIAIYEAIAILEALKILHKSKNTDGRRLTIHCDNIGVAFNLISGSSKCPITSSIIAECWNIMKKKLIFPWITYVRSEHNPSDWLTRSYLEDRHKNSMKLIKFFKLTPEARIFIDNRRIWKKPHSIAKSIRTSTPFQVNFPSISEEELVRTQKAKMKTFESKKTHALT